MVHRAEKYKNAAIRLATAVCRDAIWHEDACNWIGSTNEDYYGMPRSIAKALGTSFYDGTAGIAFFLTALHRLHKDRILEKTAQGALQQMITHELNGTVKGDFLYGKLGFYSGWPGCVFVLQYAGEVFRNKQYTEAAKELVNKCMELPQQYWGLDIIDGAASAIPALIRFYKKHKSARLKEFILELGEYLIAKADTKGGTSWDTMPDKTHNLTGYGHGAAGFAHAFTELYAFTGDKKYLQIVRDVAVYENQHFNQQQQNWPDFRNFTSMYNYQQPPAEQPCGLAWCHGAPGIGLSRLRAFELTQDALFKKDAEIALKTTQAGNNSLMMGNYSLCHGLFGNAELLLYAAKVFQQPKYLDDAHKLAEECIDTCIDKRLPVPNGLQTLTETPDFMLGSSGIGYFFLRLSDPEKFPAMLLIRPEDN